MKNLLVLYEIAQRASQVTSKKAFRLYEQWIQQVLRTYHDAAIEQVARIQLFRLREQYA
ncbi:MAG TPA: hypothetical protein VFX17_04000 [Patescibacteria group bacterium]|nr:hypothetical protein [Patescibacteria group bacterium]